MKAFGAAIALELPPQEASDVVQCPLCEERPRLRFLDREEVAAELAFRDRFYASRLHGQFSSAELRDVTNALLATPADILRCATCGILVRAGAPDDEAFRDDRYDARVLESLHRTHAAAFRAKDADYRPLLPSGSRVAEIGSYAGGFLAAAAEWGWAAIGLDIGRDTTRFTRALGFDVRCLRFEDAAFEKKSLDAVFIWNCFEQLAACGATLDAIHPILRPPGILVIRIPDTDFYIRCEEELRANRDRESALHILAYNGLLGWPHRFGFGIAAIRRLAERHQFALQRVLRRPAIRPLRNAMRSWAQAEESELIDRESFGWIEATFHKMEGGVR